MTGLAAESWHRRPVRLFLARRDRDYTILKGWDARDSQYVSAMLMAVDTSRYALHVMKSCTFEILFIGQLCQPQSLSS